MFCICVLMSRRMRWWGGDVFHPYDSEAKSAKQSIDTSWCCWIPIFNLASILTLLCTMSQYKSRCKSHRFVELFLRELNLHTLIKADHTPTDWYIDNGAKTLKLDGNNLNVVTFAMETELFLSRIIWCASWYIEIWSILLEFFY